MCKKMRHDFSLFISQSKLIHSDNLLDDRRSGVLRRCVIEILYFVTSFPGACIRILVEVLLNSNRASMNLFGWLIPPVRPHKSISPGNGKTPKRKLRNEMMYITDKRKNKTKSLTDKRIQH